MDKLLYRLMWALFALFVTLVGLWLWVRVIAP